MNVLSPTTIEDVQQAVRDHGPVLPHGARTKAPLAHAAAGVTALDMRGLTGIIEYQPEEFTFTARAGTPLREIEAMLADHGQYLPFDPPLADQGATLAGTVAANVSGPGQKRYGGVRDFLIGARFIDGTGQLIRGGGKVVKNAAGFDLPKLLVGSCGRLGAIVELTFKVFPRPEAQRTLRVTGESLDDALERMAKLNRQPFDLDALDLEPPATLVVRISGNAAAIDAHARRIADFLERDAKIMPEDAAATYWSAQRAFEWLASDHALMKFALTPQRVPAFEQAIGDNDAPRRYAACANVAWLAWPMDRQLPALPVSGLTVRGPAGDGSPRVGRPSHDSAPFAERIKNALDPQGRFAALIE